MKRNAGCGALLLVLAINASVGAMCFDYSLATIIGKDIPWYGDLIAGTLGGQFTIPVALICWIVKLCGVAVPFIS